MWDILEFFDFLDKMGKTLISLIYSIDWAYFLINGKEIKSTGLFYAYDHRSRPDSQVSVDNKSQILAENYAAATKDESQRDDIDSLYYALRNRYGTRYWSYAAHHIISGNQVFKQLTELVRLADFLHYDINNAKNCIYLASKEEGYGAVRKDQRNISAYDVMSVSKLQWHVGGHQYSFAKDELPVLRHNIEKAHHIPNA